MCSFLFNLNNGRSEGVASASQGSFWGCRERLGLTSKCRAFLTARKQAVGEATRLNRMVQSRWPLGLRRLQLGDVLRVCPGASMGGGEAAGSHGASDLGRVGSPEGGRIPRTSLLVLRRSVRMRKLLSRRCFGAANVRPWGVGAPLTPHTFRVTFR